jgi:hypothetical protein
MKYLLLAYTKQADWDNTDFTSEEFQAMCRFYEELGAELTESGEMVGTEGLAHPSLARTVRLRDGAPVALDGPYAEMKEVLASFAIVDCATHERAMEIASRITANIGDTVEVRPIMEAGPGDAVGAATGTSTPARTRSRRRCWSRRPSGRPKACPTSRAAG